MKKLSLLLALAMLLSCVSLPAAFAEGAATEDRLTSYEQVNSLITVIPAEGDQI